jgi:hypothetical protein
MGKADADLKPTWGRTADALVKDAYTAGFVTFESANGSETKGLLSP